VVVMEVATFRTVDSYKELISLLHACLRNITFLSDRPWPFLGLINSTNTEVFYPIFDIAVWTWLHVILSQFL
jgi:hypothetical protein